MRGDTVPPPIPFLRRVREIPSPFSRGLDRLRIRSRATALLIIGCVVAVTFLPAILAGEPERNPPLAQQIEGQTVYAFLLFTVITFLLARTDLGGLRYFGFGKVPFPRAARLGLLYGIAVFPPVIALSAGMALMVRKFGLEQPAQAVFDTFQNPAVPLWGKGVLAGFPVLIAPVYEEMLFRGLLFPALLGNRANGWGAALLCGAAFAAIHMQATLFLPLLLLSLFLCAGYLTTGSLVTPILMHMVFNGINLLLWCLVQ
ncbi:MAG: CPBP family intramembrane metalloprotease [Kiritimatiellae bacterium]|nr:CPBP family intramembrane metalloprotease [Kiritimatiellia bacterium]